jgi:hypothetical protein
MSDAAGLLALAQAQRAEAQQRVAALEATLDHFRDHLIRQGADPADLRFYETLAIDIALTRATEQNARAFVRSLTSG